MLVRQIMHALSFACAASSPVCPHWCLPLGVCVCVCVCTFTHLYAYIHINIYTIHIYIYIYFLLNHKITSQDHYYSTQSYTGIGSTYTGATRFKTFAGIAICVDFGRSIYPTKMGITPRPLQEGFTGFTTIHAIPEGTPTMTHKTLNFTYDLT